MKYQPTQNYSNQSTVPARFANLILMAGIIGLLATACYAVYRLVNPIYIPDSEVVVVDKFYIVATALALVGAVALFLGFWLDANKRVNAAICLVFTVISIYGAEIFLEISSRVPRYDPVIARDRLAENRFERASQLGKPFDLRSKHEVVNQLIAEGYEAYPNYFPFLARDLGGLPLGEGRIYPLSGSSQTMTVYCNEGGFWSTFLSDEHGFNNPLNLYQPDSVDMVVVGDSYAEGACVNAEETIAANLRNHGSRAVSLSKGSNGPLTQLATINEYAKQLRPKVVIWLYATNDLSDLEKERDIGFLQNYLLKEDYSQRLFFRQREIDLAVKSFIGSELEKKVIKEIIEEKEARKSAELKKTRRIEIHALSIVRIIKLYNFRLLLALTPKTILTPDNSSRDNDIGRLFHQILIEARNLVGKWDGTLVFVYLAPYERYKTDVPHSEKKKVIEIVENLGIPVIDSHREAFSRYPDPTIFFPLGLNGHYNAEGYKVLAKLLHDRLREFIQN